MSSETINLSGVPRASSKSIKIIRGGAPQKSKRQRLLDKRRDLIRSYKQLGEEIRTVERELEQIKQRLS